MSVRPSRATSRASVFDHATKAERRVFEIARLGIGVTTPGGRAGDDAPPSASTHRRQHGRGDRDHGSDHRLELSATGLDRRIGGERWGGAAGVVHQDVNRAELIFYALEVRLDRLRVAERPGERDIARLKRLDRLTDPRKAGLVDIRQRQLTPSCPRGSAMARPKPPAAPKTSATRSLTPSSIVKAPMHWLTASIGAFYLRPRCTGS